MLLGASRPLILGHRGAPFEAPENTVRGFAIARAHGADGVELDVQPSADGVAVVIHDRTLGRTTNARGRVPLLPWETIAPVRAGGEPVPRLEDAAAWAVESGAWLNVEIKSRGAEAASVAAIRAAGLEERTFFSSFVPEVVAEVGRLAPDATRCFLTERWTRSVRLTVEALGVQGVCPCDAIATPGLLAELHEAGLAAVIWTVDDPARMRELLIMGVHALITNRPEIGARVRREVEADFHPPD